MRPVWPETARILIYQCRERGERRARKAPILAPRKRAPPEGVAAGRFHADLYHRLNGVGFSLPPRRDQLGRIERMAHQAK